jgi:2-methylcitrate dehydratase PrpD
MRLGDEESPTRALTRFVAETRYEDLPNDAVHETKRVLLDSVGVALGSLSTERGRIALAYARHLGGPPEATILGAWDKVSCRSAAFANGEMISDLDFDARTKSGDWTIHLTPFVTPAPLAFAERENASGRSLILAVAVAHEVGARILSSVSSRSSRELTEPLVYGYSTGAFGGTAGSCSVLGYDRDKVANALGIACQMIPVPTAGKWRLGAHSPIHKYCLAGWQGEIAVAAATLAGMGYYSDSTFLDGERGFWRMYGTTDDPQWGDLTDGLGEKWHIQGADYKFYPHCAITHPHLDAFASIIMENRLEPSEIEGVEVRGSPAGIFNPLRQNREIRTHLDTQFSIYYGFAAVAYGVKPVHWQDPRVFTDPRLVGFMEKVTYEADTARKGAVTVRSKRGVFEREVASKRRRVSDDALEEKFRAVAGSVLGDSRTQALMEGIMSLEKLENVRDLTNRITVDR